MPYTVERVIRADDRNAGRLREAHRAYWQHLAEQGILLGGGPRHDVRGDILVIEAPDEMALRRILRDDPYARERLVVETRTRAWEAVMGHVLPTGMERAVAGRPRSAAGPPPARGRTPAPKRPTDGPEARAPRDFLTPHEQRIARMMLEGMTNQRIAERFDVSTRAVEQHITRIYRKLSIRCRAQLAQALHGVSAAPRPERPRLTA
ncbi:LuxR C-terminal-related transcriptional regulator [Streptomyces sp. NPDC092296]|uniref:LuxR C-terminal-related transcriptional regulator n=1 Tax=Streptomyces sp. NPDC092296 TaxID=3366012 RepID=UPI00381E3881